MKSLDKAARGSRHLTKMLKFSRIAAWTLARVGGWGGLDRQERDLRKNDGWLDVGKGLKWTPRQASLVRTIS